MPANKTEAPAFKIELNGTRLAADKDADIKEIIVEENVDTPSKSRIIISDEKGSWADDPDVELGTTVKISLGYKDDYTEVFQGEITGVGSRFIENGGKNFEIQCHNKLHRLTKVKKTQSFADMTYSDIISQIASDAGLQSDVDSIGSQMKFCMQRNKSDYDFLMEVARKYNCKVFMDENKLCFKILQGGGQDVVTVEWNKTLLDFRADLDSLPLATAVETRGWDPEKLESIVGSKTYSDINTTIGGSEVGNKTVNDTFGEFKQIVIDENIIDSESADNLALDLLTENSFNYVVGKSKMRGNPDVKVGNNISIQSVGTKFSGSYYVKSVNHQMSVEDGYTTSAVITRNAV